MKKFAMGIHYVVEHRKITSPFSIYGPEIHLCTKPRGNNNITLCVLGENIFTVDTFTQNYKMYSFSRHYVSVISLYLLLQQKKILLFSPLLYSIHVYHKKHNNIIHIIMCVHSFTPTQKITKTNTKRFFLGI